MPKLRVMQIIDSLDAGGGERMAVNIANELARHGIESHLCATRRGGPLQECIHEDVHYLELNRRGKLGLLGIFKLITYLRRHKVDIVHAHASSVFVAFVATFFCGIRFIWHDHYGKAEKLKERSSFSRRLFSRKMTAIIAVNQLLVEWSQEVLKFPREKVYFLRNFPDIHFANCQLKKKLPACEGLRLVHVANFRRQKNHANLLRAFARVAKENSSVQLLMVGLEVDLVYLAEMKSLATELKLDEQVFFLGSRSDIPAILQASDIGVLSSDSEGLPVALLEYGQAGLPVVCTDVGQCAEVLGNGEFGLVVPPKNSEALAEALKTLLSNKVQSQALAKRLKKHIEMNYSKEAMVAKLIKIYKADK